MTTTLDPAALKAALKVFNSYRTLKYDDAFKDGLQTYLSLALPSSSAAEAGKVEGGVPLIFNYKNYRGEISERHVMPISVRFGSTEWHPEPQWLLLAYDLDKKANREFAMQDIAPPVQQGEVVAWMSWDDSGIARYLSLTKPRNYWANQIPLYTTPPAPNSGGLSMAQQHDALWNSWEKGVSIRGTLDNLHAFGFQISRIPASESK